MEPSNTATTVYLRLGTEYVCNIYLSETSKVLQNSNAAIISTSNIKLSHDKIHIQRRRSERWQDKWNSAFRPSSGSENIFSLQMNVHEIAIRKRVKISLKIN
jgi:hypothetical protein